MSPARERWIYRTYAPLYHSIGMPPLPIVRGGKKPAIEKWQRFSDEAMTPQELVGLIERHADLGVGGAMGAAVPGEPGRFWLAHDVDNEQLLTMEIIRFWLGDMPTKIGKKGFTGFYKVGAGYTSSKKFSVEGVEGHTSEWLAKKSQTVLPRTPHPEMPPDQPYHFTTAIDILKLPSLAPAADGWQMEVLRDYAENVADRRERHEKMRLMTCGCDGCKSSNPRVAKSAGTSHDLCVSQVDSLVQRGWEDPDVYAYITWAKRAACARNGREYHWPQADSVIGEWIESARLKHGSTRALTQPSVAQMIVDEHGRTLCYVLPDYQKAHFRVYQGGYFAEEVSDQPHTVRNMVVARLRSMGPETYDPKRAKSKGKPEHILLQTSSNVRGIVDFIKDNKRIHREVRDFNRDRLLLAKGEEVMELREGGQVEDLLREARPDDMITQQLNCHIDPRATCPEYDRLLREILGDYGQDLADVIYMWWQLLGRSAAGQTRDRNNLIILFGLGGNGKSTLIDPVVTLLGDYASTINAHSIVGKDPNQELHLAKSRRLLRIVERDPDRPGKRADGPDFALLRDAVEGGVVPTRGLFRDEYNRDPFIANWWWPVNEMPEFPGTDGSWDRNLVLRFTRRFIGEGQDTKLKERLVAEYPGILNGIARGAQEWLAHGLRVPDVIRMETSGYQREADPVRQWMEARLIRAEGAQTPKTQIYEDYSEWAKRRGLHALNNVTFGMKLAQLGIRGAEKGKAKVKVWVGVRLAPPEEDSGKYEGKF